MKMKIKIIVTSLALSVFLSTILFPIYGYAFAFFTYSMFFLGALVVFALPLSILVERVSMEKRFPGLLIKYIIYLLPGFILWFYFKELGVLILSTIVSTIYYMVEIVFTMINPKQLNKTFVVICLAYVLLFTASFIYIRLD